MMILPFSWYHCYSTSPSEMLDTLFNKFNSLSKMEINNEEDAIIFFDNLKEPLTAFLALSSELAVFFIGFYRHSIAKKVLLDIDRDYDIPGTKTIPWLQYGVNLARALAI